MPTSTESPTRPNLIDFMSFAELSDRTGWSRWQLHRWARADKLPFTPVKFGRSLFVSRAEYDRLINPEPVPDRQTYNQLFARIPVKQGGK